MPDFAYGRAKTIDVNPSTVGRAFLIIFGALVAIILLWASVAYVPAGHVGVLTIFGRVTGEVLSVSRVGNRVRIRLGALTAEVTTRSVERLELRPGAQVVASFKATATRLLPRS